MIPGTIAATRALSSDRGTPTNKNSSRQRDESSNSKRVAAETATQYYNRMRSASRERLQERQAKQIPPAPSSVPI